MWFADAMSFLVVDFVGGILRLVFGLVGGIFGSLGSGFSHRY